MNIKIVRDKISREEVAELAKEFYIEMVKGVADIQRGIIAIGGEWHIDSNQVLMEDGSTQNNLWGFNLFLDKTIQYESLINIRPLQNNRDTYIEDEKIRIAIYGIINKLVE